MYFLNNLGSLVVILAIIPLHFLVLLVLLLSKKHHLVLVRLFNKLKFYLFWNFQITTFFETFSVISMCALIAIKIVSEPIFNLLDWFWHNGWYCKLCTSNIFHRLLFLDSRWHRCFHVGEIQETRWQNYETQVRRVIQWSWFKRGSPYYFSSLFIPNAKVRARNSSCVAESIDTLVDRTIWRHLGSVDIHGVFSILQHYIKNSQGLIRWNNYRFHNVHDDVFHRFPIKP
jgi:hypothetical protein